MVKEITINLPHNFATRPYQKPFFAAMASGIKRAVLVFHRRAGKDKMCWNYMIMQAAIKKGIYYYFFPHFSQGRKILWDGIDKAGFRFLDHIPKEFISGVPNQSEMKIRLINGSIIQIIGTNNIDSIVGTNPVGCVFTEYSLQEPNAWELIRPILAENGGWAVFAFTPRGSNHGKDIYDMAMGNPAWYCELLSVDDTAAISATDVETERAAGMSEDMIQQEFYCSFTLGVEGNYYAKYMQDMRDQGRLGAVAWDPHTAVHVAYDLGYSDPTCCIFFQVYGKEIRVIDYYEASNVGFAHYMTYVKSLPYTYGKHFAPHDAEAHEKASGFSCVEVAADLGVRLTVLKKTLYMSDENGIEVVRQLFPRFYIDEKKCAKLVKGLDNYRKQFDEQHKVYKNRPLHDYASHPADAFRYLSIAVKSFFDGSSRGVSDDEADKMLDKYQPRFGS